MKTLAEKTGMGIQTRKIIFTATGVLCLMPFMSAPLALSAGIVLTLLIGQPFGDSVRKLTHLLLQVSVVGLGFGMNVNRALEAGRSGFLFTIVSLLLVLGLGYLLTRLLKLDKITGYLISAGTAICGGSAIAALAPVLKAKENQVSVALGVVFVLNSVALLVFPPIGHWLNLSQTQFGLWSAIAIHDTSSVVGAAGKYGAEALEVATTVKLARALWIIPVSFASALLFNGKGERPKIPYFIGLFVLAMLLNTYVPGIQKAGVHIAGVSKTGLTLCLFLIGSGLSLQTIKSVGFKPFLLAIALWLTISVLSLWVILVN